MTFRFKLQRVLDIKRKKEDTLHIEHNMLNDQYNSMLRELKTLQDIREAMLLEMEDKQKARISVEELLFYEKYTDILKKDIFLKKDDLKKKESELTLKKAELIEAQKDRRILEKLEDKKDQEIQDEVGLNMFYRKRNE